jgi:aspartate aminotransferase
MSLRLAGRVQRVRPSPTVSITALAGKLREEGKDIIGLSAGEPDFPTPEHIQDAANAAIRGGDTKYTAVDGSTSLKAAIQGKFARDNKLDFQLDEIIVSAGGKQVCYNACQALLQIGDEVIIPAPYWVSYPDMVRLAGAEPVIVPTMSSAKFRMSAEQLRNAITPQTRAIFVNSPCNPTGTVYSRDDWLAWGEVLREHPDVILITDDIYEHISWGAPFLSFLTVCPDLHEQVLTVNGVSKCYAMTGWRLGYGAGPAALIRAMTTIQSQSTTNACSISQAAADAALTGDQGFVPEACAIYKTRHDLITAGLNDLPGFDCPASDGAFYAFPNIADALALTGIADDTAFCARLLEQAGVALVPGSAFGAPGHLRVSFAAEIETLEAALTRLRAFMASEGPAEHG